MNTLLRILGAGLLALALGSALAAGDRYITVASTTSTENSGLFDVMLPAFRKATGIDVRVVAVGTGQALKIARNGDADVLFVHHKPSEQQFVSEGYGVQRFDVMYNDFVIVGPAADPAAIEGTTDVTAALQKIAARAAPFASRGDDSGTHKKELSLWRAADIDVREASGGWYRETGSGMGATLNVATAMGAYALTDRATWLKFSNKGTHRILSEGDSRLYNQYGVILVNPDRHSHIKRADGQRFIDWVLSRQGQSVIGSYEIGGQAAFFANAGAR